MVEAAVVTVTRGSIAPGVQAGSGSRPWLTQPVVLVRGDGVQGAEMIVGSGTAAVASGAAVGARVGGGVGARVGGSVGARVGAAVGNTVGATVGGRVGGGAAGAQLLRPSAVATITQRSQAIRGVGVPLVE